MVWSATRRAFHTATVPVRTCCHSRGSRYRSSIAWAR